MNYVRMFLFFVILLSDSACMSEKEDVRQVLTPPEISIPTPSQGSVTEITSTSVPELKDTDASTQQRNEVDRNQILSSEESAGSQNKELKLYLNGNKLPLEQKPLLIDNNVMIPVAEICTYFSRSITSEQNDNILKITDEKKGNKIIISAGEKISKINDKDAEMLVPAVLSDEGVMLIELSSVRTLLDADFKFNSEFLSVYINESGLC